MISNESGDKVQTECQFLRNEVSRLNQSYKACKNESDSLKEEFKKLDVSIVFFTSFYLFYHSSGTKLQINLLVVLVVVITL